MMKPVSLCLDFGNTNYKCGIFNGDKLIHTVSFSEENALKEIGYLLDHQKPEKVILSSVVNHSKDIDQLLASQTKFVYLTDETPLPFLNAYGTPKTLGRDRMALVAGLKKYYKDQNALAISIGTCITYNFLQANGTFRGGAISPGIELRLRSMHEFTDQLPLVRKEGFNPFLGFDTETSLRSGVIFGITSEIDGMIARYQDEFGKINAVLTGGDTRFFASRLKNEIFADEFFNFKGLYAILDFQKDL